MMDSPRLDIAAGTAIRVTLVPFGGAQRFEGFYGDVMRSGEMEISSEQKEAWKNNPETAEYEELIGPIYKSEDGATDIEALLTFAEKAGLDDVRTRYAHLNSGQIAMNIRNGIRCVWRRGELQKLREDKP